MSESLMKRLPSRREERQAEADALRALHKAVDDHGRALEVVGDALTVARRSLEHVKAAAEKLEEIARAPR
jgi:hypothetical protein